MDTIVVENGEYKNQPETTLPEITDFTLSGFQRTIRTLCFNPLNDGILLSGGISDSTIHVWDLET